MILGTEANLIEEACHSHPQFLASLPMKGLGKNAEARTEDTQARVINTPIAQLKKCKLSYQSYHGHMSAKLISFKSKVHAEIY